MVIASTRWNVTPMASQVWRGTRGRLFGSPLVLVLSRHPSGDPHMESPTYVQWSSHVITCHHHQPQYQLGPHDCFDGQHFAYQTYHHGFI
jgi:hypothetical protein